MAYYYTDPRRESDPHALPDVEIFKDTVYRILHCKRCHRENDESNNPACIECHYEASILDVIADDGENPADYDCVAESTNREGWFFAFGMPGYLYDSDIYGPYATEAEALAEAREWDDDTTG